MLSDIKKIYIGADLLMTKESEQKNNIEWLYDFISLPIKASIKNEIEILKIDENFQFDRSFFFKKSNLVFNKYELHNFFNTESVNSKSLAYLKEYLTDCLFIGYELSEETRKILEMIDIRYIDIWLHPIRFLDDVLFGFYSNDEIINNRLKAFDTNEEKYYLYAQRLKIQSYKGISKAKEKIEKNSALFAGQTLIDKAIYSDGKMLTILDFKDKFEALVNEFKTVYYIPHPFIKNGDEFIMEYIKSFKNVIVLRGKDSMYHILSNPNIEKVVSISSSVVLEAKYFGKKYEYYYKPVIEINKYTSVYQSFLYSYFWSKILDGTIETNSVELVVFDDTKDKIRDALSFYWSYRDIEKVELLKRTVGSLFKKKRESSIEEKILKSQIISFDIFDTLISRKYYSPTEIFTYMEPKVSNITNGKIDSFRRIRIKAQSNTLEIARSKGKQDVTLDEIYNYMHERYDLTIEQIDEIKELEIQFEYKCVQKKEKGYKLYSYCLENKLNMILTSDMYLPRDVIFKLLSIAGYDIDNFDKLYLSSELGKRKTEGDLYDHICNELNIAPLSIIHIGDNFKGDIEMSSKKGLNNLYTPKTNINFINSGMPNKGIDSFFRKNLDQSSSLVIQNIAEKFYQDISDSSLFNSSEYKLGYKGLGPLISGFVYWLFENAKRDGIKTLAFLSRDGKIFKDAFDTIKQNDIETKYIYSSRHIVKLSSINSLEKIEDIVLGPIYSTRLDKWLKIKFDLDIEDLSLDVIKEKGFDIFTNIGNKVNRDNLMYIVEYHKSIIYNKSKVNLEEYKEYLINNKLNNKNMAVVDIGYAGSMQIFFNKIFDSDIKGYYLSTFDTYIRKSGNRNARGYLTSFSNSDDKAFTICTDRFLFEALICSDEYSFTKIEHKRPIFNINRDDYIRKRKVKNIHEGIIDFIISLNSSINALNVDFQLKPKVASHIFDSFIKYPQYNDVLLMENIVFEDNNGPDVLRYIIPPMDKNIHRTHIIWAKGYEVLLKKPIKKLIKKPIKKPIKNNYYFENKLINFFLNSKKYKKYGSKKYEKYCRDRESFFLDSNNKYVRIYYRLLGSKL